MYQNALLVDFLIDKKYFLKKRYPGAVFKQFALFYYDQYSLQAFVRLIALNQQD